MAVEPIDRDLKAVPREEGPAWDAALLVPYPSRTAFSRMTADPEHQEVSRWRTVALEQAVLQSTMPWTAG